MHARIVRAAAGLTGALFASTSGATPTAPGYVVSFVEVASGPAVGDVVSASGSLFVGVGPQNAAGAGRVVRIDAPGLPAQQETVVAEQFTALGGMDYDAANGRLFVADNGLEFGGPTGDNVYLLTSLFGNPVDPPDALALALLADGAVPGAFDVLLDPSDPGGDTLFVSDSSAVFPPAGRLLQVSVSGGSASVVQSGLGFAAGLASDGTDLYLGDVDGFSFEGAVFAVPLAAPGDPLDPRATGLAGIFDLEPSGDGTLLAASGARVLRIDPTTGDASVVASGFGFATGLFEDGAGVLYALDGFAAPGEENRIWVFTPVPEPGAGALLAAGVLALAARRRRAARLTRPRRG